VLPRRPGARFALEALFLVLLAIGAGLANLRPLIIVLVMGGAWALVALAELSVERMGRTPVSYLPLASADDEEEPQDVFGPRPEERTIVAPPAQEPAASEVLAPVEESPEEEAVAEPQPEVEVEPEPEPEPEPEVEHALEPVVADPEPAGWDEAADAKPEVEEEQAPPPRKRRGFLRRREPEVEPEPAPPPRHVKLLPRRPAEEPSGASQEVAELFGSTPEDEPAHSEENRG
jgi:hypothetical protein